MKNIPKMYINFEEKRINFTKKNWTKSFFSADFRTRNKTRKVNKMVERTKPQAFEEFEGKVESIQLERSKLLDGSEQEQYHITIVPLNVTVEGKTGRMHEWIRISPKATETTVPEGSVLDRYLSQIEILHSEAKKQKTHLEAMNLLNGNSYLWKKTKLGKSFEGKEAKDYWIPVKPVF